MRAYSFRYLIFFQTHINSTALLSVIFLFFFKFIFVLRNSGFILGYQFGTLVKRMIDSNEFSTGKIPQASVKLCLFTCIENLAQCLDM